MKGAVRAEKKIFSSSWKAYFLTGKGERSVDGRGRGDHSKSSATLGGEIWLVSQKTLYHWTLSYCQRYNHAHCARYVNWLLEKMRMWNAWHSRLQKRNQRKPQLELQGRLSHPSWDFKYIKSPSPSPAIPSKMGFQINQKRRSSFPDPWTWVWECW